MERRREMGSLPRQGEWMRVGVGNRMERGAAKRVRFLDCCVSMRTQSSVVRACREMCIACGRTV